MLRRCCFLLCAIALLLPTIGCTQTLQDLPRISVSIPDLKVSDETFVISLQVKAVAGAFEAVTGVPPGWHMTIDNDGTWTSTVTAQTTVGSFALDRKTLRDLHFRIIKDESLETFELTGTVLVTLDYETQTEIPLTASDFSVIAVP